MILSVLIVWLLMQQDTQHVDDSGTHWALRARAGVVDGRLSSDRLSECVGAARELSDE